MVDRALPSCFFGNTAAAVNPTYGGAAAVYLDRDAELDPQSIRGDTLSPGPGQSDREGDASDYAESAANAGTDDDLDPMSSEPTRKMTLWSRTVSPDPHSTTDTAAEPFYMDSSVVDDAAALRSGGGGGVGGGGGGGNHPILHVKVTDAADLYDPESDLADATPDQVPPPKEVPS